MKRTTQFRWIACTILLIGINLRASSQSIKAVETPVCSFMLILDEDINTLMELDGKTTMALAMQLKNPEARKLMDESYEILQRMLNDSTSVTIPEAATLKGAVKYSLLDYPIGTLKRAAKNSSYDQYVAIDIMIERPQSSTSTSTFSDPETSIEVGRERIRIRPQVRVILKFAGADGKVIGRYVGKYRHDEKFEINGNTIGFGGFRLTKDIVAEPIPYHFFLTKAIEDLIRQLPK